MHTLTIKKGEKSQKNPWVHDYSLSKAFFDNMQHYKEDIFTTMLDVGRRKTLSLTLNITFWNEDTNLTLNVNTLPVNIIPFSCPVFGGRNLPLTNRIFCYLVSYWYARIGIWVMPVFGLGLINKTILNILFRSFFFTSFFTFALMFWEISAYNKRNKKQDVT